MKFAYEAFTAEGKSAWGHLDASSRAEVLEMIHARGLVPFSVVAHLDVNGLEAPARISRRKKTPSLVQRADLLHELGTLLRAQLPLDQALRIVAGQFGSRQIRAILLKAQDAVADGKLLSEAAADLSLLPAEDIAAIRAGEQIGDAARVLLDLSTQLRRRAELNARISASLTYPAIVVVMCLLSVLVIATQLVPNLMPLFEGTSREVPLVLRLLAGVDAVIRHWWWLTLGFAVGLAFVLRHIAMSGRLYAIWAELLFKLPVVRELAGMAEAARVSRILAILMRSGSTVLKALVIARDTCKNRAISGSLDTVISQIRSGTRFSATLQSLTFLPPASRHLIAVGEEVNRLDEMLLHVAEINEQAVQRRVERLMTFLTPALTAAMGLLVGLLILSVMHVVLSVDDLVLQ